MGYWRKCTTCKKEIGFSAVYWVCSVSTCNRNRTGLVFCSVSCWDAHVPVMNHKESWAIEKRAPSVPQDDPASDRRGEGTAGAPAVAQSSARPAPAREDSSPRRSIPPQQSSTPRPGGGPAPLNSSVPRETLVVVSKTKDYVRARSGMNTSEAVMDVLSDRIRRMLDDAIRNAGQDGRKTVMDRDFR